MIKDLAELKKFLAICRKQGVKDIKFGEISVAFGDAPQKSGATADDSDDVDTEGELTPEQLMFFSAGGVSPT